MRNTTLYMLLGLGGMAFCTVMGYMTGSEMGAVAGMMGGIICFMPTVQLIIQAKGKGFLPFYWNLLEENGMKKEKYCIVPNKFGKLRIIVAKMVSDGVIFIKRFGLIDDKGTEYTFGNSPLSFVLPGFGFSKSIVSSQYHHFLKKEKEINDWDEAVKKFLGLEGYKKFCEKFRVNPEPDSEDIQAELQYLKDVRTPVDPLATMICGETYTFHDDIEFFKYNYHPQVMKVFVENEKINVRREEMGYKDPSKAKNWAMAIMIIIIGVVILLAVLSSIDLSQLGSLFGGGSKQVVTHVVNNTTVVP